MVELKKRKITANVIEYNDWDRFVNDYFGLEGTDKYGYKVFPYEFCADHEANNDSTYEFTTGFEWSNDDYAVRVLNESIDRVEKWAKDPNSISYITGDLFDYFYHKGILDKGVHYIEVSW